MIRIMSREVSLSSRELFIVIENLSILFIHIGWYYPYQGNISIDRDPEFIYVSPSDIKGAEAVLKFYKEAKITTGRYHPELLKRNIITKIFKHLA